MTGQPKTISEDDRLKAFALAVMANDLYRQACKADMAMQRMLGMEARYFGDGCIGNVIYDGETALTSAAFDEALKSDGFVVAAAT